MLNGQVDGRLLSIVLSGGVNSSLGINPNGLRVPPSLFLGGWGWPVWNAFRIAAHRHLLIAPSQEDGGHSLSIHIG